MLTQAHTHTHTHTYIYTVYMNDIVYVCRHFACAKTNCINCTFKYIQYIYMYTCASCDIESHATFVRNALRIRQALTMHSARQLRLMFLMQAGPKFWCPPKTSLLVMQVT